MEEPFVSTGMVSVIIPDAGTVKFHVFDDSVVYEYRDHIVVSL